jgi:hypothetical protein
MNTNGLLHSCWAYECSWLKVPIVVEVDFLRSETTRQETI